MRCVYRATGPLDVYLVRDWLDRNGIEAWVRGEHCMGGSGALPIAWPSLWVRADDEARATGAVRAFEGPVLVHPDWQCACGETNGPAFGACWACGAEARRA